MALAERLQSAFRSFVKRGHLEIQLPGGTRLTAGDGGMPRVSIRFTDAKALRELLLDAEMKLGELYMDGRLIFEEGRIYDLFQLVLQDSGGERRSMPGQVLIRMRSLLRKIAAHNSLRRAKHNVAHHYDLGNQLYDLFLDADRQYSCAYFERPDMTLEEAQLTKKRHIAAKLLIEPTSSVLDIGCGWGGLGLYLAEVAGAARVRGVTLSEEQLGTAQARAAARGLASVDFVLEDYRQTQGRFDRIVSVGMFEHVGPDHYRAFFERSAQLLARDGVMLLHTIGHTGRPAYTNPWITKYIFPGGYIPSLSEMIPEIERAGLVLNDVEVLRLHYAETLRNWRDRFMARWDEAKALHDERFCRMWECYLAMSEASFRWTDVVVFQLQLTRRNDAVPMTRGYIAEREAALEAREAAIGPSLPGVSDRDRSKSAAE